MSAYPADELLKLSLGFEKAAQKLYMAWAKKFSRFPEVAAFWQEYAEDEAVHARLLKELHARLSREQLAIPIKCKLVGDTQKLLLTFRKDKVEDFEQVF